MNFLQKNKNREGESPPTFGGTSQIQVASHRKFGGSGCEGVPPCGWRNLPFGETLAEPEQVVILTTCSLSLQSTPALAWPAEKNYHFFVPGEWDADENKENRPLPLIVQKFGGSSVATAERIMAAARRAIRAKQAGDRKSTRLNSSH